MNTIVVTDSLNKAIFIQSGLKYEHFRCDLVTITDFIENTEKHFGLNHGVFIFIESFNNLTLVLNKILTLRPDFPLVVLMKTQDERSRIFLNKTAINSVFVFPYPFRLIAAEMRVFIYKNREKIKNAEVALRSLMLNRSTREVFYKNSRIRLRNREFTLLEFLMLNQGRLLSRETILEAVWDRNSQILTNTVDVHINKLRSKIDYAFREEFIRTINCSGYIFS